MQRNWEAKQKSWFAQDSFGGIKEKEKRKPGLDLEMHCGFEKMQEIGCICV